MIPARRGFDPHDLEAVQRDDRLVLEGELVVHEGASQFPLRVEPIGGPDSDGVVKEADRVATVLFGVIHRRVGIAQQRLGG